MVLPNSIHEQSPLDPLILLPLPEILPRSPAAELAPLLDLLEQELTQTTIKDDLTVNAEAGPSTSHMAVLTAHMRQTTRHAQVQLNAARVGAAQGRHELDTVDVDLRGVEYEWNRVQAEIRKCEAYEPAYKELDLPPLEEFSAAVDQEVLASLPSDHEEGHEYHLTMARLRQELAEVEKREALVAALTKEREGIIRAKKEIKNSFNGVETYLTDYAKSTTVMTRRVGEATKVAVPASGSS